MLRNKFLLSCMILAVSPIAFGASNSLADYNPGFYVGGQAGYSQVDYGSGAEDSTNLYANQNGLSKEIDKGNFGGRGFVGWNFLPYFSLETGYAMYSGSTYKASGIEVLKFKDFGVFDLMAKGILPLELLSPHLVGWNVYGKAGVAMMLIKEHIGSIGSEDSSTFENTTVKYLPAYALGIGYDFNSHFGIDVSWSGIYSSDKLTSNDISNRTNKAPSVNLIAVGLSYKF